MITVKAEFPPDNLDADFNNRFIRNLEEAVTYIRCNTHGTDCNITLAVGLTAPGYKYDVINPCCEDMEVRLVRIAIRILYNTQFPPSGFGSTKE